MSLWNGIKRTIWKRMGLRGKLPGGIPFEVLDGAEWLVFLDIFVRHEYDEALNNLACTEQKGIKVLDLGGNAGFFMLRAADWCLRNGVSLDLWSVEPSDRCCKRIREQASLIRNSSIQVQVIRGAAGKREGKGYFCENVFHLASDVSLGERKGSLGVDFVDLARINGGRFDLIKADIEGMEAPLVESYPDLLAWCRIFVVEIHRPESDLEKIKKACSCAGLAEAKCLQHGSGGEVWMFTRKGGCG